MKMKHRSSQTQFKGMETDAECSSKEGAWRYPPSAQVHASSVTVAIRLNTKRYFHFLSFCVIAKTSSDSFWLDKTGTNVNLS